MRNEWFAVNKQSGEFPVQIYRMIDCKVNTALHRTKMPLKLQLEVILTQLENT